MIARSRWIGLFLVMGAVLYCHGGDHAVPAMEIQDSEPRAQPMGSQGYWQLVLHEQVKSAGVIRVVPLVYFFIPAEYIHPSADGVKASLHAKGKEYVAYVVMDGAKHMVHVGAADGCCCNGYFGSCGLRTFKEVDGRQLQLYCIRKRFCKLLIEQGVYWLRI